MTNRSDKIAIICNSFSASLYFRQSLIEHLSQTGRMAAVASPLDDSKTLPPGTDHFPRVVIDGNLIGLWRAARALREAGTGLCHGFTHAGNVVAFVIALLLRVPVIMNITGMGRAFSSAGWRNLIMRAGLLCFYSLAQFRTKAVIVQNVDDQALISQLFLPSNRGRIHKTNGSGIANSFFDGVVRADLGQPQTKVRVGFFSRALPEKGVIEYYSLARSYRDNPDIEFFHIGHAGSGDFAPDRITKHAAGSNITYITFQPDPRPYELAMDIIVLPSIYREGLSRLCIEAMLAGKVVVAQDTTGVREHLVTGTNGFLYRTTDDLQSTFAAALASDLHAIGVTAKDYAYENFDVRDVDQVYLRCYAQSLDATFG